MKPFRFPLERVLEWRKEQAERERAALRLLAGERDAVLAHRHSLEAQRAEEERALLNDAVLDVSRLAALETWRAWVRGETARLEIALREVEERISAQRQRVVEAERKVRLLERLRDKSFRNWRLALDKELENFAAEAYLMRWKSRSFTAH